jgi:hypothetical protein
MSGAPVLNLRTGAVCGILNRTRSSTAALGGFAISVERLFELNPSLRAENRRYHNDNRAEWSDLLPRGAQRLLGLDAVPTEDVSVCEEGHPTVFISHAHADKEYACQLAALLIERGIRVWIDYLELRVGDSVIQRVSEAIAEGDFLLAIVSADSVRSAWCKRELALAQTRGIKEKVVVVLPIRYRGATMPAGLVDAFWLDGDRDDVVAIADRLVHDIRRHRAAGKPSTDQEWLEGALRVYRTETPEARARWLFQLEGARLRAEMDVPIDGGRHYETVLKLCEVGALRELRRSRRG